MSFKTLTCHEPYPHQIETYEALAKGKSIILLVPKGSEKSEAEIVKSHDYMAGNQDIVFECIEDLMLLLIAGRTSL